MNKRIAHRIMSPTALPIAHLSHRISNFGHLEMRKPPSISSHRLDIGSKYLSHSSPVSIDRPPNRGRHCEELIRRFKKLDRNKEVYKMFEKFARETIGFQFPNASEVFRKRIAQSIAAQRARFLYLEQHQKKTSTLHEPTPVLKQNIVG